MGYSKTNSNINPDINPNTDPHPKFPDGSMLLHDITALSGLQFYLTHSLEITWH